MALYRWSTKVFSRGKGASVLRAAAYRAGEKLTEVSAVHAAAYRSGQSLTDDDHVHDYTRRGGVADSQILLPAGAAPWLADRQRLWSAVEIAEKRKDAQLAREIVVSLPPELTEQQRRDLLHGYLQREFVGRGMICDVNIHHPRVEKGEDPRNFHAHVLIPFRTGVASGLASTKTRDWNELFRNKLVDRRQVWANACNASLARAGQAVRVDHRSLAQQRAAALSRGDLMAAQLLDRQPEVHMGPNAVNLARKGRLSLRVDLNRQIIERNQRGAYERHLQASAQLVRQQVIAFTARANPNSGQQNRTIYNLARKQRRPPPSPAPHVPKFSAWMRLSPFEHGRPLITDREIGWALYSMGLITQEQLNAAKIELGARAALRWAQARQLSFWARLQRHSRKAARARSETPPRTRIISPPPT